MSKTSGADPITREQVERALNAVIAGDTLAMWEVFTPGVGRALPGYVYEALGLSLAATEAALTRWRDELAAAEPVRAAVTPRPVVQRFALLMEEVLRANDHKTGWLDMSVRALMERLEQETAELREVVDAHITGHDIAPGGLPLPVRVRLLREAADVANFALMIADETEWRIGNERAPVAAAEPVQRVARWDAALGHYVLTPPITSDYRATTDPYAAIAWGYEIEGGPEPTPAEDSPERLRERRERLGLSMVEAADLAKISIDDVEALEGMCRRWPDCDRCGEMRPAYAAALSAEEARRVAEAKPHMTPAFRKVIAEMRAGGASLSEVADAYSLGIGEVSEALYAESMAPERPAPRFKVGDLDPALREVALTAMRMLHCGKWPLSLPRVRELPGFDAWNSGPLTSPDWIAQLEALLAETASPPAPEVVDVPQPRQPIVKRCGGVAASWQPDGTCLFIDGGAASVHAPIPLLRAMLADIDAQQGGAS